MSRFILRCETTRDMPASNDQRDFAGGEGSCNLRNRGEWAFLTMFVCNRRCQSGNYVPFSTCRLQVFALGYFFAYLND